MANVKLKNKSGVPIGYTDVDIISIPDLDTDDNIEYRNVELGTLNVTSNGEYTPSGNNVWNKVNVNVPAPPSKFGSLVDRSITTVTAEDLVGVTVIGIGAFMYCNSLSSITIPNSVTSIGSSAFEHCISLSSITIPNSVISIGSIVFSSCTSLSSIIIPNSVTRIEYSVFSSCTSLIEVTIPNSVTSIDSFAFYNCTSLSSFTCLPTIPPTIKSDTFNNVPSTMNIYVPSASVDAYKSASYWSDRADHIFAISE